MRGTRIAIFVFGVIVAALAAMGAVHADVQEAPDAPSRAETAPQPDASDPREDATLWSVDFVDSQHGWAVGDAGTVLRTLDAGESWQRLPPLSDGALQSVSFVTAEKGWAAGSAWHPYTPWHDGQLWITADGGQSWNRDRGVLLPGIRRVTFFDHVRARICGDPASEFPGALMATTTAGRAWASAQGPTTSGWRDAAWWSLDRGLVVGLDGRLARVEGLTNAPIALPSDLRRVTAVAVSERYAYLAGEGGLLLASDDGGATWRRCECLAAASCDFAAIAARGARGWAVGAPAGQIWRTLDGGATWSAHPCGAAGVLTDVEFVDDESGWAVGSLGTIVATCDGGQTWHSQRGEGRRAAVLALVDEPENMPLELAARWAGEEGYHFAVEVLHRRWARQSETYRDTAVERAHQAVVATGGAGAWDTWRFPLPDVGEETPAPRLAEAWRRQSGVDPREAFIHHLAQRVRMWRPDVLVLEMGNNRLADAVFDRRDAVLAGVRRAADASWSCDGGPAWQVRKAMVRAKGDEKADHRLHASAWLAARERALGDAVLIPRGWASSESTETPAVIGYRALGTGELPQPAGRDLMSGIVLAPGSDARRSRTEGSVAAHALGESARRLRHVRAVVGAAASQRAPRVLGEVAPLIGELPPEAGGAAWFTLGSTLASAGEWPLAAEAFEQLIDGFPGHRLVPSALWWLVRYWSSAEAAHRATKTPALATLRPQSLAEGLRATDGKVASPARSGVTRTSAVEPLSTTAERFSRAAEAAERLAMLASESRTSPAVQLPLMALARATNSPPATNHESLLALIARDGSWRRAIEAEAWLARREGPAPVDGIVLETTSARPTLDGHLDEPLWATPGNALASPAADDARWPARVRFACDERYLYFSAECLRPPGVAAATSVSERPRDAELAGDRITLLLDIDRDREVFYTFAFDRLGRSAEQCWNDISWDPRWFVATHEDEARWVAEVAIALDALAPFESRGAWCLAVARHVPEGCYQCFPAVLNPRAPGAGMALVMFPPR